ncbi:MAG: NAD-dependent epimerase/dehydratase family protein [bacterium]
MANKTILVTGGAGHVGSHLIELLVANSDDRVISLDNYFNGRRENHVPGAEYRDGHTKNIQDLVPETPDIIYHLGEYARIASSFEDVAQVYDMNITGTFAVAEFCRTRKIGKLVYAGSSTKFAIEGNGRHQNPYSFTKATNVDLINDYGAWYQLPYAICYFYNAFGPREVAEGKQATLIAKFENQYKRGEPLTIVGDGEQRRAFTHVKDLARGIALVGDRGWGDGYALGNPRSYSILDVAAAFGGPVVFVDGYAGRQESENDLTKAAELGWRATVDVMSYIADFKAGLRS